MISAPVEAAMELREECMPCRSMSLVAAVKPLEMELDTDLPKLARSSIGRSFVAFCEKFFQSANGAAAGGEVRRAFRGGTGTARRGRGVRGTDHDPRAGRGARGGGTRADAPDMNVGPSEPDALIDGGRWTSAPRPRSWVAASAPRARTSSYTRAASSDLWTTNKEERNTRVWR